VVNAVSSKEYYNPETSNNSAVLNKRNRILYTMSVQEALNDKDTKKQNKITKGLFYAAPIVDSVLFSAVNASQTNSLAKTMGHFGKRLATWGLMLGFINLASAGVDKLTEKSKTLSTLKKERPELKTLADIGAIYGAFTLANSGFSKLASKIPENIKRQVLDKKDELIGNIDSSKISKKIFTPALDSAKTFFAKHAKLSKGIKCVIPSVAGALILGSIIKSALFDTARLKNKVVNNYTELRQELAYKANIPNQD
jgi:hypothetical protein